MNQSLLAALIAANGAKFPLPPSFFLPGRPGKHQRARAAFRNAVERRHRQKKAARKQKTVLRRLARSRA